jgi:hypothetical protein
MLTPPDRTKIADPAWRAFLATCLGLVGACAAYVDSDFIGRVTPGAAFLVDVRVGLLAAAVFGVLATLIGWRRFAANPSPSIWAALVCSFWYRCPQRVSSRSKRRLSLGLPRPTAHGPAPRSQPVRAAPGPFSRSERATRAWPVRWTWPRARLFRRAFSRDPSRAARTATTRTAARAGPRHGSPCRARRSVPHISRLAMRATGPAAPAITTQSLKVSARTVRAR